MCLCGTLCGQLRTQHTHDQNRNNWCRSKRNGKRKKIALDARCSISAVADPVESAGRKFAETYPDVKVFTEIAPMLEEVDGVIISSPNWLHPEQAIQCAEAGKHVWIEKPMALTVADGEKMAAAINKAGVASMVGFSVRFEKTAQGIKRRFQAGDLGEWFSGASRRNCTLKSMDKGWRTDFTRSGGVMSELIIHELDWATDLFGFPKSIFCRKRASDRSASAHPKDNDHVWISLNYYDDRTVTIEGSQIAPIADYYKTVVGTEGSLHTRRWGQELYYQKKGEKDVLVENLEGMNKHSHWLDVIEGKCASVADVNYGLKITKLIDSALESAVSGLPVDLDL
ncbi:MAG: Gfo/Idh/MocA family oxidoreductase [Opitutales bacterium]|nr:Gfo/Idh/MocA family oxidoreductase [Opitutales bacterium]NRA27705.1 Gfo/Idh/MocA family oxidoreductase [Opitutales bacterium]